MSVLAVGMVLGQLAGAAPAPNQAMLSIGDRSEARVRSRLVGSGEAFDVETSPGATLTYTTPHVTWLAAYFARLAYLDLIDAPQGIISHSARLGFGWMTTRRLRLDLTADGSIGKQFSEALVQPNLAPTTTPTTTPTLAVPVTVINSVNYRAELSASYRLSRPVDLQVSGSYGGGEGLDDASRAIIPAFSGPSGQVGVAYSANRQDRFSTRLRVGYISAPSVGSEFLSATLSEGWLHAWTQRTSGSAALGVDWLLSKTGRDSPHDSSVFPSGELALNHSVPLHRGETLSFRAATRLGVRYDPVLRVAEPQVGGNLLAGWATLHYGASVNLDGIVAIPLNPGDPAARQLTGSLVTFYQPGVAVRLETGLRGYILDLNAAPATVTGVNSVNWTVFLAVTLTAPPIVF